MDFYRHHCKNPPCGEVCKSTYCGNCATKDKREEQIKQNLKIAQENALKGFNVSQPVKNT